jgi:hypothetical protein
MATLTQIIPIRKRSRNGHTSYIIKEATEFIMKTTLSFRNTYFLSVVLMTFVPRAWAEQDTNQTSTLTYGEVTNGIRGEIELISFQRRPTDIFVFVNHVADTNFVRPNFYAIYDKLITNDWDYWMPTNSFCGPIELRDSTGRKLPPLKPDPSRLKNYKGDELPLDPEVSSLASYPPTYSLQTESARHFRQFRWYSGPGIFPMVLFFTSPRSDLVRFIIRDPSKPKEPAPVPTLFERWFQLTDYFDIKQPGEYQLTVWPKIYKRSATNSDICERIDIPPVTVTIKWDGKSSSSK